MNCITLQSSVSYGLVDNRAVFLDLRHDRYVTLDPAGELAFRQIRSQEPRSSAYRAAASRLLATGLFRSTSTGGRLTPVAVPRPPASLLDETPISSAGCPAAVRAWRAVLNARRRLRTVPLLDIVSAVGTRPSAAAVDLPETYDAARVFLAARGIVPIERSCLLDALALLEWLGDRSGNATLVFGVRMNPFRAHCWIQTDSLLLTDASDTVGALVPVLAV